VSKVKNREYVVRVRETVYSDYIVKAKCKEEALARVNAGEGETCRVVDRLDFHAEYAEEND
jgi:hypothetical protein